MKTFKTWRIELHFYLHQLRKKTRNIWVVRLGLTSDKLGFAWMITGWFWFIRSIESILLLVDVIKNGNVSSSSCLARSFLLLFFSLPSFYLFSTFPFSFLLNCFYLLVIFPLYFVRFGDSIGFLFVFMYAFSEFFTFVLKRYNKNTNEPRGMCI